MSASAITWTGESGSGYEYWIYPVGTAFRAVAGNYIFSKRGSDGLWYAVYIGETADLSSRFNQHHQARCIRLAGATHIHVHSSPNGADLRRAEETDLRARYRPACNLQ